jgi:hypothetical protein
MPKVEPPHPAVFAVNWPGLGTSLIAQMENTFHYPGKSMSQFFPVKGKNLSFSSPTFRP